MTEFTCIKVVNCIMPVYPTYLLSYLLIKIARAKKAESFFKQQKTSLFYGRHSRRSTKKQSTLWDTFSLTSYAYDSKQY